MNKQKIICVICARGGSKRLKNKNFKSLFGKPLIYHTIKQAIDSKIFDTIVTRHKYNSSNLGRPSEESCYASKPKGGGQQLLELAEKDKFGKVKSEYNVNNNYGLSQAQWANYITYCQWF